jgi:hypothetical protein
MGWVKEGSLRKKFFYICERARVRRKCLAMEREAERIKAARRRCERQIVYDLTTDKRVTEEQKDLLSLGLNFGIAPKRVPVVEHIASIESVVQQLERQGSVEAIKRAAELKALTLKELRRASRLTIHCNITEREREVLEGLKRDDSLLIVPADKGRVVVVMDRGTYLEKMQDQLGDDCVEMPAEKVAMGGEKGLLDQLHSRLVEELKVLGVDTRGGNALTVTAPEMAKMYLLIKVHKEGFPGRPVVSQIGDPTYNVAKVLTGILNPLDEGGRSFIKNSIELKRALKEVKLGRNSRLASFDVKALYPSIPVGKALEVVREKLEEDDTLAQRTPWSPAQIMRLLEICLETHFKTIDGRVFTQIDGTPIGKSISGPIAGIYMNWFEEQYIYSEACTHKPTLWRRQRDDVFTVWDHGDEKLQELLGHINGQERRVQFTLEKELNGMLAFLDLKMQREGEGIVTSVYRKPTHTFRYLHWRSNHPKRTKLGVMKCLIHRAHSLCDRKEDLDSELEFLKDQFLANGYPLQEVDRVFSSYEPEVGVERELELEAGVEEGLEEEDKPTIFVPYVPGFSQKFAQRLRVCGGVEVVFTKPVSLQSELCNLKPPRDRQQRKDVVYKVDCAECGATYIGETAQRFADRARQHQYCVRTGKETNGFFVHAAHHHGGEEEVEEGAEVHMFRWEGAQFLDSDCHWKRRKIKESLFINAYRARQGGDLMNLEGGTRVDPCWKALNDLILEEGERRIKACRGSGRGLGGDSIVRSRGRRPLLRRSERLMKKQRCQYGDEGDLGGVGRYLQTVSPVPRFSLGQQGERPRGARVKKRGKGRGKG